MNMKMVRIFGGLLAACCVGMGMTGCSDDAKKRTAVAVTLKCSEDMLGSANPHFTFLWSGDRNGSGCCSYWVYNIIFQHLGI